MEAEAMAAQCWSSLPADLVNCVAVRLLVTNDLDYYMDLRAVCHHWRSATADPRSNPHDPRFHPTRWIMLDEHKLSSVFIGEDDDTRLFVNTTTGRFLCKSLPLLRGYHLVTYISTVGGFVILSEREPPHAARVLNPFTGCVIRFKAPVPFELSMTANVAAVGDDLLVLVLGAAPSDRCPIDDHELRFYLADPDSKHFSLRTWTTTPSSGGAATSTSSSNTTVPAMDRVSPPLLLVPSNAVVVEPGEILLVDRPRATGERLTSIGSRAFFVGAARCFSVDAGSFPSVEANCIYHNNREGTMGACFPVPIVQLLMEYTVRPTSTQCFYKPAWEQPMRNLRDICFPNPTSDD